MPCFYFTDVINEELFSRFTDFVNEMVEERAAQQALFPITVYIDSAGGELRYVTPIVRMLEMLDADIEVVRACSAAFDIICLTKQPISIGIEAVGMCHKASMDLPFPAPKQDDSYKFAKRMHKASAEKLDAMAMIVLNAEQFQQYQSGDDVYMTADEMYAAVCRATEARESGKLDFMFKEVINAREYEQPDAGQDDNTSACNGGCGADTGGEVSETVQ